jgi:hypothetical protein
MGDHAWPVVDCNDRYLADMGLTDSCLQTALYAFAYVNTKYEWYNHRFACDMILL